MNTFSTIQTIIFCNSCVRVIPNISTFDSNPTLLHCKQILYIHLAQQFICMVRIRNRWAIWLNHVVHLSAFPLTLTSISFQQVRYRHFGAWLYQERWAMKKMGVEGRIACLSGFCPEPTLLLWCLSTVMGLYDWPSMEVAIHWWSGTGDRARLRTWKDFRGRRLEWNLKDYGRMWYTKYNGPQKYTLFIIRRKSQTGTSTLLVY